VKTLLNRIIPLLLSIAAGSVISWVSIYSFWFAVWTFHSLPVARAADAVGSFILYPGRWVFEAVGGDQSTIFYDAIPFAGTNGLILGILLYCVYRAVAKGRAGRKAVAVERREERRVEARVGN